ncbi:TIGR01777 family oxidoreductase [Longimicrobium sp.]|uniref:TIGR01777 family oxidoreductase n=1 Tax=Longimicrobium sp. TaxID=2029185 RepID=UPI002E303F1A|nr:TIGR01777 family oxidoreductase [Longimicrobium sp.]HEX6038655.1 TIGR01777 family oxidoreductase [Longimicrobium sp.]
MRVAVTGASGLIGQALVDRLRREGHTVARLVRDPAKAAPGDVVWNPEAGTIDAAALEGIDAVVHLAGENVGTRWTEEKKRRILASREQGTSLIARTIAGLTRPPRVLVQASAVGIYGDRGDETLTEASPPGTGFLAEVGQAWEAASAPAEAAGIRVVKLRIGVVLTAKGGALEQLMLPFKMGVGGRIGSGRQWMPWISLDDVVEVILRAIRDERLRGPVNTATGSVRNEEFTEALGRALHRPTLIPVPAFGIRALFGQMADEALLAGQRVEPARLSEIGHAFHHPTLDVALAAALRE